MGNFFSCGYVCMFDDHSDTREEHKKLLLEKLEAIRWDLVECAWLSSDPEDAEALREEVRECIEWLFFDETNEFYDAAVFKAPYSNWFGNPVKMLFYGGMTSGDYVSESDSMVTKLYETLLPLTTSEELILARRVQERRGLLCPSAL